MISLAVCAGGCATFDEPDTVRRGDRFEPINRITHKFNTGLDRLIVKPAARGYDRVIPEPVDRRVRNFFANLRAPLDITNNFLQGKFAHGFSGIGRLVVNTTVGLGGLFDPAAKIGMPRHAEDFGQTLAAWRLPSGPYIVLPVLGPSNLRDIVGLAVDWQLDPLVQHEDTSERNSLVTIRLIVARAELLSSERNREIAFDEYIYLREAYLQQRLYELYDGDPPADEDYLQDFLLPRK